LSAELVKVLSLVTLEEDESRQTAMTVSQSTKKIFLASVCPPGTEPMKNHLLLFFIGIQAGGKFSSAELKRCLWSGIHKTGFHSTLSPLSVYLPVEIKSDSKGSFTLSFVCYLLSFSCYPGVYWHVRSGLLKWLESYGFLMRDCV